jgi:hypothetical protein
MFSNVLENGHVLGTVNINVVLIMYETWSLHEYRVKIPHLQEMDK